MIKPGLIILLPYPIPTRPDINYVNGAVDFFSSGIVEFCELPESRSTLLCAFRPGRLFDR